MKQALLRGPECREIRERLGLTQDEFATRVGVAHGFQVSRWETGAMRIPRKRALKILDLVRPADAPK